MFAALFWEFNIRPWMAEELRLYHVLKSLKKTIKHGGIDTELLEDFVVSYEANGTARGDGFQGLYRVVFDWINKGRKKDGLDIKKVGECLDIIVQLTPPNIRGRIQSWHGMTKHYTSNDPYDFVSTESKIFTVREISWAPNCSCQEQYIEKYGESVVTIGTDFSFPPAMISLRRDPFMLREPFSYWHGASCVSWQLAEPVPTGDYTLGMIGDVE